MSGVSAFAQSSDPALVAVLREAGVPEVRLSDGETLFNEGDAAAEAYYVVEGSIQVLHVDDQRRVQLLGVVEAGELFGEAAFLSATARAASARAVKDTVVLALARDSLARVVARTPAFTMFLIKLFSGRLRSANAASHESELAGGLNRRVIASLEADKKRMAAELARGVRAPLTEAQQAIGAARALARSEPARLPAALKKLNVQLADMAAHLDYQIAVISREISQNEGLVPFLERRLSRMKADTGVDVRFECPPIPDEQLRGHTRKALFALVDASVSLACQVAHAKATTVKIALDDEHVTITVADDGTAHDVNEFARGKHPEAFGLYQALRGRVLLSAGTMELAARPGGGTLVTIRLPLHEGGRAA